MSYLSEKLGNDTVVPLLRISGFYQFEIPNFMDGKRNLFDIYRAVCAEYGAIPPADVKDFTELLRKAGLVVYK